MHYYKFRTFQSPQMYEPSYPITKVYSDDLIIYPQSHYALLMPLCYLTAGFYCYAVKLTQHLV